jgi:hypothetical protein
MCCVRIVAPLKTSSYFNRKMFRAVSILVAALLCIASCQCAPADTIFDVDAALSNAATEGQAQAQDQQSAALNLIHDHHAPSPTGIFGFTFPNANPVAAIFTPFRWVFNSLFGGTVLVNQLSNQINVKAD